MEHGETDGGAKRCNLYWSRLRMRARCKNIGMPLVALRRDQIAVQKRDGVRWAMQQATRSARSEREGCTCSFSGSAGEAALE
jgi:hypothetical protein